MTAMMRKLIDLRIPVSPELVVGMTVIAVAAAILGAYVLVLLVGP